MSSVFCADIQTPLAVPDPCTDYMLPPAGSLSYGSITAESALGGTNGVDTLLVAGNRDRQMNGNESTRITQDRSHTVGGNQQKKITGDKQENVTGNFHQTTLSNLHRTVVGATNDVYTAPHTIKHTGDQQVQQPDNFFHAVNTTANKGAEYAQNYGVYRSLIGRYENVVGINIDLKGLQIGFTGGVAETSGNKILEQIFKSDDSEIQIMAMAVETTVMAVNVSMGGGMMHEVAITQKILVVGANQVI